MIFFFFLILYAKYTIILFLTEIMEKRLIACTDVPWTVNEDMFMYTSVLMYIMKMYSTLSSNARNLDAT